MSLTQLDGPLSDWRSDTLEEDRILGELVRQDVALRIDSVFVGALPSGPTENPVVQEVETLPPIREAEDRAPATTLSASVRLPR